MSEFPEEETFFVNFLREPVDPTGDEEEDFSTEAPKVYEEIPPLVSKPQLGWLRTIFGLISSYANGTI